AGNSDRKFLRGRWRCTAVELTNDSQYRFVDGRIATAFDEFNAHCLALRIEPDVVPNVLKRQFPGTRVALQGILESLCQETGVRTHATATAGHATTAAGCDAKRVRTSLRLTVNGHCLAWFRRWRCVIRR